VAKDAFVYECMMQVVLKTLVQNLEMCRHGHGHDMVFDVESCLARIAHMLNISCADQVNVSINLVLLIMSWQAGLRHTCGLLYNCHSVVDILSNAFSLCDMICKSSLLFSR